MTLIQKVSTGYTLDAKNRMSNISATLQSHGPLELRIPDNKDKCVAQYQTIQ